MTRITEQDTIVIWESPICAWRQRAALQPRSSGISPRLSVSPRLSD